MITQANASTSERDLATPTPAPPHKGEGLLKQALLKELK